ncbi:integrase core domain-containing protein [Streptomyces sp. NBC_00057]|uniref:integrase core domain-containing protein n=1 Tax=Streptomyces sp. NBC_00057 TaxID=2975634 RepID=UPI00386AD517
MENRSCTDGVTRAGGKSYRGDPAAGRQPGPALAAALAASIGTVGNALDNALMESAIGLYKTELIKPQRPWKALGNVELATAEWVDWCNHGRLHGEIGHVPPVEYEAVHYQQQQNPQVTATI